MSAAGSTGPPCLWPVEGNRARLNHKKFPAFAARATWMLPSIPIGRAVTDSKKEIVIMKNLITSSALVALFATPAYALDATQAQELPAAMEEQTPPAATDDAGSAMPNDESRPDTAAAPKFIDRQQEQQVLASALIGTKTYNRADEDLGSVSDVVFAETGEVDAAIVGVGGFLGIGSKSVAISFDAIEQSMDADGNMKLVLDATKEELEAAPAYVTLAQLKREQEAHDQEPLGLLSEPPPNQ
jgi:hypothetical protein